MVASQSNPGSHEAHAKGIAAILKIDKTPLALLSEGLSKMTVSMHNQSRRQVRTVYPACWRSRFHYQSLTDAIADQEGSFHGSN